MKTNPTIKEAQKALRNGNFLGQDKRALATILRADDQIVRAHGLTHRQIAARLAALRDAALPALGAPVLVPPHFEVRAESERGLLVCPFDDSSVLAKTNMIVYNQARKQTLIYTDMHIHFIAEHGFYEGRGAPMRLEPQTLIEILWP